MDAAFPHGRFLRLLTGDITQIRVDVMVNAANSELRAGGGVDGAIHRAGGPELARELEKIRAEQGRCAVGHAVVTSAGALPARQVFHTVGPVYRNGKSGEPEQLAECYRTCLRLAEEHEARSISFPAISTGAYGYPLEEAARIAVNTIADHLRDPNTSVREVFLILWDQASYDAHARALSRVVPETGI